MDFKILSFFLFCLLLKVKGAHEGGIPNNPAFDPQFYKDLLDPELCVEQLDYITRNNLFLRLQCKFQAFMIIENTSSYDYLCKTNSTVETSVLPIERYLINRSP